MGGTFSASVDVGAVPLRMERSVPACVGSGGPVGTGGGGGKGSTGVGGICWWKAPV